MPLPSHRNISNGIRYLLKALGQNQEGNQHIFLLESLALALRINMKGKQEVSVLYENF